MTDRTCWRCRHNTPSNLCTIVNDGDGAEAVAVREWIDEHVSDENGMMPAQETPTACPGHQNGEHRREETK